MNGACDDSSMTDSPNGRQSTTAVRKPARPVVRIRHGMAGPALPGPKPVDDPLGASVGRRVGVAAVVGIAPRMRPARAPAGS